jgi:hypothetical protein
MVEIPRAPLRTWAGAPGKLKIKSPNDQIHPLQIVRLNFHPLPRRTLQTLAFPIEHIPRVINKS